jgi:hypothetical protein
VLAACAPVRWRRRPAQTAWPHRFRVHRAPDDRIEAGQGGGRQAAGRVLEAPEDRLNDDGAEVQADREKFDDDAPKLSDIDRTRRTRELLDMEKDVQRMQREFNEDLFQRKNEERAAIARRPIN